MKFLNRPNLSIVYLKPGEICLAEKPTLVKTVLGSCVSVTLCNKNLGIGVICHATLPRFNGDRTENCFKFVDCSVKHMVKMMTFYGGKLKDLEVKLFGGSDMFQTNNLSGARITIGEQNIKMAIKMIKHEGLILSKSEVGGQRGRKIYFYTDTGEVYLKFIRKETAK